MNASAETPKSSPRLAVIVVAADSGEILGECVRSALAAEAVDQVILVDNASADGLPRQLHEEIHDPRFQLERNERNRGFGAAANQGARLTRADILLFLNPDCLLERDTVTRLLSTLRDSPGIGLLGALVCTADGHAEPASRRRDPLLRRALVSLSGLDRRAVRDARFEGIAVDGRPSGIVECDAVSGALMLLPHPVFERLGGFDEGYFLHCEDLDLCRRVRDAGLKVALAADVRVIHAQGSSSRHRPVFVSWHKHRGMWRWFGKFDPAARNPLIRAIVWCGIWAHFLLQLPVLAWRGTRARGTSPGSQASA